MTNDAARAVVITGKYAVRTSPKEKHNSLTRMGGLSTAAGQYLARCVHPSASIMNILVIAQNLSLDEGLEEVHL